MAVVIEKRPAHSIVEGCDRAELARLAKSVGFKPLRIALKQDALIACLERNNIPIYDAHQVQKHMTKLAKDKDKVWTWKPLRKKDRKSKCKWPQWEASGWQFDYDHGAVRSTKLYKRPVPISVLLTVETVMKEVPNARFFVSDYSSRRPDPFLAVGLPGHDLIVIDFWDEPTFHPQ